MLPLRPAVASTAATSPTAEIATVTLLLASAATSNSSTAAIPTPHYADTAIQYALRSCFVLHQAATVTKVGYNELIENFAISKAAAEFFIDWTNHRPSNIDCNIEHVAKLSVQLAVHHLANITPVPVVKLQTKPSKSVYSDIAHQPGKLVLVPETTRITCQSGSAQPPNGGLQCEVPEHMKTNGQTYWLMPQYSEKYAVPAWIVRTTEDDSAANIEVQQRQIYVSASSSKGAGSKGKGNQSSCFTIPVLTNSKAVKKGDELFIYKEPQPKAKVAKRGLSVSLHNNQRAKR